MALRNLVALVLTALVVSSACFPQAKSATQEEPALRAPFKLKLHVDDDRYYELSFDQIPYVAGNDVYLFTGEAFGLNVTVTENEVSHIAYERSPANAEAELRFTQEKSQNGGMMMLVIRNKLKRRLYLDALMTRPGSDEIFTTNVLPVEPNLSDFRVLASSHRSACASELPFFRKAESPGEGERTDRNCGPEDRRSASANPDPCQHEKQ